jgi:hypothetical protein
MKNKKMNMLASAVGNPMFGKKKYTTSCAGDGRNLADKRSSKQQTDSKQKWINAQQQTNEKRVRYGFPAHIDDETTF